MVGSKEELEALSGRTVRGLGADGLLWGFGAAVGPAGSHQSHPSRYTHYTQPTTSPTPPHVTRQVTDLHRYFIDDITIPSRHPPTTPTPPASPITPTSPHVTHHTSPRQVSDLHRHFIDDITIPSCQGKGVLRRVEDVFDCWFESGSMPYGQVCALCVRVDQSCLTVFTSHV